VQAKAIPIPGILGVVVGLAFGWFIFRIGKEASLKKLLIASTIHQARHTYSYATTTAPYATTNNRVIRFRS